MTSIKDLSTEDLEKELERRKEEEKRKKAPALRSSVDLKLDVENFASQVHHYYTCEVATYGREPKDGSHYLYEMLIDFLYGKEEYFDWFNNTLE